MVPAGAPAVEPPPHPVIALVEWLAKVWAPLTAWTFAVTTAYWFEFRHVYAVPVSFASATTIAALPALAGIVLGSFAATIGLVLLPSLVLWLPVGDKHRRLMDAHEAEPTGAWFSNPFASTNLGRLWLSVNVLFAACLTVTFLALPRLGVKSSVVQTVALCLPMLAGVLLFQRARTRAGIVGRHAVWFNLVLAWVMLVQWLLVSHGISLALDVIRGQPLLLALFIALDAVSLAIGVFAAQFVFAIGARVRWRGVSPRGALLGVLALSALPLAVPTLGARLAAVPLGANGPDGKTCVVLVASDKATSLAWQDISADPTKPPVTSKPLIFATLLDSYFVKVNLDSPTLTIPVDGVRRVNACP